MKCLLLALSLLAAITAFAQPSEDWPLSNDITLVYITDDTIEELGSFPFNRKVYADYLNALYEHYDPAVAYMDIFIVDPNKDLPESDVALAEAVKGKDNVIFGAIPGKRKLSMETLAGLGNSIWAGNMDQAYKINGALLPLDPILENGATAAMAYATLNEQGHFDSFPVGFYVRGIPLPTTPVAMVRDYAALSPEDQSLMIKAIATDKHGNFKVDYDHRFATLDLLEILNGTANPDLINGRIVILGAFFSGGADVKPIGRNYLISGAEMTAHATQTLLDAFKAQKATEQ